MDNTVTMSFDNGRNRMRIQKSTLDALGEPHQIVMFNSKNERKFVPQSFTLLKQNGTASKRGTSWNS